MYVTFFLLAGVETSDNKLIALCVRLINHYWVWKHDTRIIYGKTVLLMWNLSTWRQEKMMVLHSPPPSLSHTSPIINKIKQKCMCIVCGKPPPSSLMTARLANLDFITATSNPASQSPMSHPLIVWPASELTFSSQWLGDNYCFILYFCINRNVCI